MQTSKYSTAAVKSWQTFLIQQGLLAANGADGRFGPNTLAATKAYQTKKGLNPGTADEQTTLQAAATDGFVLPKAPAPTTLFYLDAVFDISHHNKGVNGHLDFAQARSAGAVGVIHKATEGQQMNDEFYLSRKPQAQAAGLLWGAYHFGYPGDGATQADHFLSVIGTPGDVLPVLDLEQRTKPNHPEILLPSMSLQDAAAFITRFKEKTGKYPGLYGGPMIKQYMRSGDAAQTAVLRQCWLWLAQYSSRPVLPVGWTQWTFWQYSDGNTVTSTLPTPLEGIGAVDRDFFNGDADGLKAFWAAQCV